MNKYKATKLFPILYFPVIGNLGFKYWLDWPIFGIIVGFIVGLIANILLSSNTEGRGEVAPGLFEHDTRKINSLEEILEVPYYFFYLMFEFIIKSTGCLIVILLIIGTILGIIYLIIESIL